MNVRPCSDLKHCFEELSENPECRVILLTGAGKHFTSGLDLKEAMQWGQELAAIEDSARKGHYLEKKIKLYQVRLLKLVSFLQDFILMHFSYSIFSGCHLIIGSMQETSNCGYTFRVHWRRSEFNICS